MLVCVCMMRWRLIQGGRAFRQLGQGSGSDPDKIFTDNIASSVCVCVCECIGCTVTQVSLVSLVQVRCSETCGQLSALRCRGRQREEEERGTSPQPRGACWCVPLNEWCWGRPFQSMSNFCRSEAESNPTWACGGAWIEATRRRAASRWVEACRRLRMVTLVFRMILGFYCLSLLVLHMSFTLLPSGFSDPVLRALVQPGFLSYQWETTVVGSRAKALFSSWIESSAGFLPSGLGLNNPWWFCWMVSWLIMFLFFCFFTCFAVLFEHMMLMVKSCRPVSPF